MYTIIEIQGFCRERRSVCRDEREMRDYIDSLPSLHYLSHEDDRCAVLCAPGSTVIVIKEQ